MDSEELSFWDHLHDLRKYLIRSVIFFIVAFIAAFVFKDILFDGFLLRLMDPDFPVYSWIQQIADASGMEFDTTKIGFTLISTKLSGQFMAHISLSALAAFIVSVPFILFQLWKFIKPALYEREIKAIRRGFWWTFLLFACGSAFAYFIITPLSIIFLGNYQVSELVKNTITLDSYLSVFSSTIFFTGLLFILPMLLMVLGRAGIIKAATLRHFRRHAMVAGIALSAIITPTTDPFTMLIVALPLLLLYEAGIIILRKNERKHVAKNNA